MRRVNKTKYAAAVKKICKAVLATYLRFALLRASQHTTNRWRAEDLAVYAISAALFCNDQFKYLLPFGRLIDIMIDLAADNFKHDPFPGLNGRPILPEHLLPYAAAINRLDPRSRQIFTLYYIENIPCDQLSAMFGTTDAGIRRTLRLAHDFIEDTIEQNVLARRIIAKRLRQLADELKCNNLRQITKDVLRCIAIPCPARRRKTSLRC